MNRFHLLVAAVIAAGFAGAALTLLIATGLEAATGLHEFSVITVLWLICKSVDTYINLETV